jgi:hypothetical protein
VFHKELASTDLVSIGGGLYSATLLASSNSRAMILTKIGAVAAKASSAAVGFAIRSSGGTYLLGNGTTSVMIPLDKTGAAGPPGIELGYEAMVGAGENLEIVTDGQQAMIVFGDCDAV